ncbi:MAG: DUF6498-containing protein [Candidatus Pacebacteria bacterium]|jgi:hypothetical protein|nr:DUF6498-containing protein [Candidatus Paceibacterota bacterium]
METENTNIGREKKLTIAEERRLLVNSSLRDPSLYVLLLSNLATAYFAVVEHWSLPSVMLVYWQQSVTIGFFNFIKILQLKNFSTEGFKINGKQPLPTRGTQIQTAFFFLFHYGIFHAAYFAFLAGMFSMAGDNRGAEYLFTVSAIFFLNHLFSYLYNRPWAEEKQNIGTVMIGPYARIIPMHLTILFAIPAGFIFGAAGSILIFLVLKTLIDAVTHVVSHYKEHVFSLGLGK